MSYCEHCEGQRFDRARVLRTLRQMRKDLRSRQRCSADLALSLAIQAVRALEVPHLDLIEEADEVVH